MCPVDFGGVKVIYDGWEWILCCGALMMGVDPVLPWHGWPAEGGPAMSSEMPVHVGLREVRRSGLLTRHRSLQSPLHSNC